MTASTLNLTTAFSREELGLLRQQLTYAAEQQQRERRRPRQRLTFRSLARLLYWQAGYTALAQAVTAALQGQPCFSLPSAGATWLSFLRCERYRAESALHHLEDKALPVEIKQELVRALETEARLYALLLDPLTGPTPFPDDMTPLLFVSIPKAGSREYGVRSRG